MFLQLLRVISCSAPKYKSFPVHLNLDPNSKVSGAKCDLCRTDIANNANIMNPMSIDLLSGSMREAKFELIFTSNPAPIQGIPTTIHGLCGQTLLIAYFILVNIFNHKKKDQKFHCFTEDINTYSGKEKVIYYLDSAAGHFGGNNKMKIICCKIRDGSKYSSGYPLFIIPGCPKNSSSLPFTKAYAISFDSSKKSILQNFKYHSVLISTSQPVRLLLSDTRDKISDQHCVRFFTGNTLTSNGKISGMKSGRIDFSGSTYAFDTSSKAKSYEFNLSTGKIADATEAKIPPVVPINPAAIKKPDNKYKIPLIILLIAVILVPVITLSYITLSSGKEDEMI